MYVVNIFVRGWGAVGQMMDSFVTSPHRAAVIDNTANRVLDSCGSEIVTFIAAASLSHTHIINATNNGLE